MGSRNHAAHTLKSLLTSAQAAAKLGISTNTLFRLQKAGKLQAAKIQGVWLFHPEDLAEYQRRFAS